jgi:hypothetical protein
MVIWGGLRREEERTSGEVVVAFGNHAAAVGGKVAFAYRQGVQGVEAADVAVVGGAVDNVVDLAVGIGIVYCRVGWIRETSGGRRGHAVAGLAEEAADAAAIAIGRASVDGDVVVGLADETVAQPGGVNLSDIVNGLLFILV